MNKRLKYLGHLAVVLTFCVASLGASESVISPLVSSEERPSSEGKVVERTLITPHWNWQNSRAERRLRVLFLVNNLATREPQELAQRFNIEPEIIGITQKGLLPEALQAALGRKPQVIVLATAGADKMLLHDTTKNLLREAVEAGTPLALFVRHWQPQSKGNIWPGCTNATDVTENVLANLPYSALPVPPQIFDAPLGKGRVMIITGYDNHFNWFSAFSPYRRHLDPMSTPITELAYAVADRVIIAASGLPTSEAKLAIPHTVNWGEALALPVPSKGTLRWTLHSPFGDAVTASDTSTLVPTGGGRHWLRWTQENEGDETAYGLSPLEIASPLMLTKTTAAGRADGLCVLAWGLNGHAAPGDRVEWQIYAPGKRLLATGDFDAAAGEGSLSVVKPLLTTYLARVLLLRGGKVLHEARVYANFPLARTLDEGRFYVDAWATECGAEIERKRLAVLRELGVTALAPSGRNENALRLFSEEGFRLVPTNVYVPGHLNRLIEQHKGKDKGEAAFRKYAGELPAYARKASEISPLGYHLADEPSGTDLLRFLRQGNDLIRQGDPEAKVGYSGFWAGGDLAPLLREVEFLTAYSPSHLYTPDLWLGVERDLYRNFRNPRGLLSCWTHYAPWKDMEPYARTVPWLWLFEGMDGVSYFDTGGEFAILPPDLRLTHETRWWSEEVRELHSGAAQQIRRARRETGQVRVVYSPGAYRFDYWIRALNQLAVPYSIIDRRDIPDKLDNDTRLVLAPSPEDMSAAELDGLRKAAERGCVIVTTASCAAWTEKDTDAGTGGREENGSGLPTVTGKKDPWLDRTLSTSELLLPLFGVSRPQDKKSAKDWAMARDLARDVPVRIGWNTNADPITVETEGSYAGETNLQANGAEILARFVRVGAYPVTEMPQEAPDYARAITATPAVFRKKHGAGAAWLLTFQPSKKELLLLLPQWVQAAGVTLPEYGISVAEDKEPQTLLYPMKDGGRLLLGVIRNYWQIPATLVLRGKDRLQTAGYFRHGPEWWGMTPAILRVPEGMYVYDTRRGKYLGQSRELSVQLQPGRPELYACLPYKLENIVLTAPATARCGEDIPVRAVFSGAQPEGHVVQFALLEEDGSTRLENSRTALTTGGSAEARIILPINAIAGKRLLRVRDVLTGLQAEQVVEFSQGRGAERALPEEQLTWSNRTLDWPEGNWEPNLPQKQAQEGKVNVQVGSLQRAPSRSPRGDMDYYCLRGWFKLGNSLQSYEAKYFVGNDWGREKETDRRKIISNAPPGLGFAAPGGSNNWWINRYLRFQVNGSYAVNNYALTSIKETPCEHGARVDLTWDTPEGMIDLAFIMLPDHPGIFQELTIRPAGTLYDVGVSFTSYPGAYSASHRFMRTAEDGKSWQLAGDALLDRAFSKGSGMVALLTLPEEWDDVTLDPSSPAMRKVYGRRPKTEQERGPDMSLNILNEEDAPMVEPLKKEKVTPSAASKTVRFHWVLFTFPDLPNKEAEKYMRQNAASTRQQLRKVFGIPDSAVLSGQ